MAGRSEPGETRHSVAVSSLDSELFDGAGVTKRQLLDYLETMADRLIARLRDRPLSVVRARPGAEPFMQKNLPRHAPDWLESTPIWSGASKREVNYPLVREVRDLIWLGNQRAVEFHPTLWRVGHDAADDLIIDLDPPAGNDPAVGFRAAVRAALDEAGLRAVVKTTGAKGLHLAVPIVADHPFDDVAAATRALAARAERHDPEVGTTEYVRDRRGGKVFLDSTRAGGATIVAAYSPRARPGVPVSCPVGWDELDDLLPAALTLETVPARLGDRDPWAEDRPDPQTLPADLIAEGHQIPVARVVAMHEGKRRKREQQPD